MNIKIDFDGGGELSGTIILKSGSGGVIVKTTIITKEGVSAESVYKDGRDCKKDNGNGNYGGDGNYDGDGKDGDDGKGCKKIETTVKDQKDGKMIIISYYHGPRIKTEGKVMVYPDPGEGASFWKRISYVIHELNVNYFIGNFLITSIFILNHVSRVPAPRRNFC